MMQTQLLFENFQICFCLKEFSRFDQGIHEPMAHHQALRMVVGSE